MGRDERFAEMRRQRMQQSQAAQRSQLVGALGSIPSAQAEPRDRFGVPIRVGDLVIHKVEPDPIFEVLDVKPVLAPNAPPGLCILTLAIQMPIYVSTQQPIGNLLVWGNVKEAAEPVQPEAVITKVAEDPSNIEKPHTSALPCGCDESANWKCDEHRSVIALTD
jgi:hypothetical protein